ARRERREREQPKAGDAQWRQLPGGAAGQSRSRVTRLRGYVDTLERTCPSASANASFSSGAPTDTRIADGAPKPASGRTITPCRSNCSNTARPSPTSAYTKLPSDGSAAACAVDVTSNARRTLLVAATTSAGATA